MPNEKKIDSRIQQKIDTLANWNKAVNFIPKKGEIIIFSDIGQFKVGDGITLLANLSYFFDIASLITVEDIDTICGTSIEVADLSEVAF